MFTSVIVPFFMLSMIMRMRGFPRYVLLMLFAA